MRSHNMTMICYFQNDEPQIRSIPTFATRADNQKMAEDTKCEMYEVLDGEEVLA